MMRRQILAYGSKFLHGADAIGRKTGSFIAPSAGYRAANIHSLLATAIVFNINAIKKGTPSCKVRPLFFSLSEVNLVRLNLYLRPQLNHAVRGDLVVIRRAAGIAEHCRKHVLAPQRHATARSW